MNRWIEGPVLLVGRLLLAVLFLPSGLRKLGSYGDTVGHIAARGLPLPALGYGIAVAVEIPLALALLVGLGTRPVAAIMALYTLATAIFFHNHIVDPAQGVNFFKNLAIAGGLLFVVAHGAGGWSLDRALRKKS
jgi:putative oxidoreductase